MLRDIAYWAGWGLASIIFSGLFAIVLGQFFRNDTPDNSGEKAADLNEGAELDYCGWVYEPGAFDSSFHPADLADEGRRDIVQS